MIYKIDEVVALVNNKEFIDFDEFRCRFVRFQDCRCWKDIIDKIKAYEINGLEDIYGYNCSVKFYFLKLIDNYLEKEPCYFGLPCDYNIKINGKYLKLLPIDFGRCRTRRGFESKARNAGYCCIHLMDDNGNFCKVWMK